MGVRKEKHRHIKSRGRRAKNFLGERSFTRGGKREERDERREREVRVCEHEVVRASVRFFSHYSWTHFGSFKRERERGEERSISFIKEGRVSSLKILCIPKSVINPS